MYVIEAMNVNDAYVYGFSCVKNNGTLMDTRAGKAYSLDAPMAVVYKNPTHRVLFDANRDANPFFHLFESLWLLAGRQDARWLDQFVGDFSSRFAEADGHLHGSYGFRWRKHFDLDGEGNPNLPDQLDTIVRLLKANPNDRRTVIQMWDAVSDLGQDRKDIPCNLLTIPRIVNGLLDLTVFNRSNDICWGMFGANVVQFSFLQEYLAGRVGVPVGKMTQISTNAHLYANHERMAPLPILMRGGYPRAVPIGTNWDKWDRDLLSFFEWAEDWEQQPYTYPDNPWFEDTAQPLFAAHAIWKAGERRQALDLIEEQGVFDIAPDWRLAAQQWMHRRIAKGEEKPRE